MEVAAAPERVWTALLETMGSPSRRGAERGAALLGCRERRASGDLEREGSTIVGFRVERADRPQTLALAGRHRFSDYALTFTIDDLEGGRSRLRATTDAAFPGAAGTIYRGLVIGTRMHVLAVRSLLARVKRAAERPAT